MYGAQQPGREADECPTYTANLRMREKIRHYSIYICDMVCESRNNDRFVFKFRNPFTQICLFPVPQTPEQKPQITPQYLPSKSFLGHL
jgi:hypothetical protein